MVENNYNANAYCKDVITCCNNRDCISSHRDNDFIHSNDALVLKNNYKIYTDHLVTFEKHVKRLYDDWVIDSDTRNRILQQLDRIVRSMIKLYNGQLINILKDLPDNHSERPLNNLVYENISSGIKMLDTIENIDTDIKDPFHDIKLELISLAEKNGYYTIHDFMKLYIGDHYQNLLNVKDLEIFHLYNKVFVPIDITIELDRNKIDMKKSFEIKKIICKCDGVMDNTCSVNITIQNIPVNFIFEGYVSADVLNVYLRTSQIYSKYLYNKKIEVKNIINTSYPEIDTSFYSHFSKLSNSSCFFVNDVIGVVDKIVYDYHIYQNLSNKHFNYIMKKFIQSDIKTMFNYINLLLMGDDQSISNATLLYNLLKDKKVSDDIHMLSDIIYRNLSYYSQIKLKKSSNTIKNELSRLKNLVPENINIEKRLASLVNMPDNVKSYIFERINELKSGENNYKLQMAINGLMQFPWKPKNSKNEFSDIKKSMNKSRNYLQNVARKLDETVYGHEDGKKILVELVGKWIQNPESTGQVIGLVGPPGVGKTLLAKSISSALGIPLSIVGLGGMSDSADLIGHSFTYAGAQYGMIVRQMIKAGNWRSVMFFDEVDKVSKRNETNEIYNTLIHITDPNMNQHFQDRFYSSSIEFDLSGVLIVFSYNDSSKLDPILLDRIKEIHISSYSSNEKVTIVQDYVLKELCNNIGFNRNKIYFEDHLIKYIIEKYTQEAGVRELKRRLEQILLKLNIDRFYMRGPFRKLMEKKYQEISQQSYKTIEVSDEKDTNLVSYLEYKKSDLEELLNEDALNDIFNLEISSSVDMTQNLIHKYLGKPTMISEEIHQDNMIGIVNGLYATSVGLGGIVPIQIYKNYVDGSGDGKNLKLKLTGNQKQVMRESVICALTTAVNILRDDIKNNIMTNFPHGFHIHAPDGGTPKDGPSAGCAFTTAFVSLLLGKKINRYVAMTGEIELTGKVSKIGGLGIKLAGAKKAGVKCVYICQDNKEDYEEVKKKNPDLFDENFQIKIINHIIDIVSDPDVIIGITDSEFDPKVINKKLIS